jgi:hypothetical protein
MRGVEARRSPGLVVHFLTILPRRSFSLLDGCGRVVSRSAKRLVRHGTERNGWTFEPRFELQPKVTSCGTGPRVAWEEKSLRH